jgi:hypothetical protein
VSRSLNVSTRIEGSVANLIAGIRCSGFDWAQSECVMRAVKWGKKKPFRTACPATQAFAVVANLSEKIVHLRVS